jgi:hypothetical protein
VKLDLDDAILVGMIFEKDGSGAASVGGQEGILGSGFLGRNIVQQGGLSGLPVFSGHAG